MTVMFHDLWVNRSFWSKKIVTLEQNNEQSFKFHSFAVGFCFLSCFKLFCNNFNPISGGKSRKSERKWSWLVREGVRGEAGWARWVNHEEAYRKPGLLFTFFFLGPLIYFFDQELKPTLKKVFTRALLLFAQYTTASRSSLIEQPYMSTWKRAIWVLMIYLTEYRAFWFDVSGHSNSKGRSHTFERIKACFQVPTILIWVCTVAVTILFPASSVEKASYMVMGCFVTCPKSSWGSQWNASFNLLFHSCLLDLFMEAKFSWGWDATCGKRFFQIFSY